VAALTGRRLFVAVMAAGEWELARAILDRRRGRPVLRRDRNLGGGGRTHARSTFRSETGKIPVGNDSPRPCEPVAPEGLDRPALMCTLVRDARPRAASPCSTSRAERRAGRRRRQAISSTGLLGRVRARDPDSRATRPAASGERFWGSRDADVASHGAGTGRWGFCRSPSTEKEWIVLWDFAKASKSLRLEALCTYGRASLFDEDREAGGRMTSRQRLPGDSLRRQRRLRGVRCRRGQDAIETTGNGQNLRPLPSWRIPQKASTASGRDEFWPRPATSWI